MNDQVDNPYKAPDSDVAQVSNGGLNGIFDRFSAWAVFGLAFITSGVYTMWWAHSRTQKLNPYIDEPIEKSFINTTFILIGCYFVGAFVTGVNTTIGAVLMFLGFVGYIMLIVWFFKLRNRLNTHLGYVKGDRNWIGPILTFFFNSTYLQYKINAVIDEENV